MLSDPRTQRSNDMLETDESEGRALKKFRPVSAPPTMSYKVISLGHHQQSNLGSTSEVATLVRTFNFQPQLMFKMSHSILRNACNLQHIFGHYLGGRRQRLLGWGLPFHHARIFDSECPVRIRFLKSLKKWKKAGTGHLSTLDLAPMKVIQQHSTASSSPFQQVLDSKHLDTMIRIFLCLQVRRTKTEGSQLRLWPRRHPW